jgi:hypothetical protein
MKDEMQENISTQLSWSDFTEEETKRGYELAKPFNSKFRDDSENSMSMFAKWMDKEGFIFSIDDDLTGSTFETVHERDLDAFLAQCMHPKPRP